MPHARQDLQALRVLASRRGGVVSAEDLRVCGFCAGGGRRRVAVGTWGRWGGAVLLSPATGEGGDAPGALGDLGLSWALQLTYGPQAAISGALALRRAGWDLSTSALIVVVLGKPRVGVPGVTVMRRQTGRALALADGLRYVPAREALLDTLVALGPDAGADLLDRALQRRFVSVESLRDAIKERLGWGRRGARTLRALLARAQTGARSEAEIRMRSLLGRCAHGPWTPNLPVRDDSGRILAEIDFAHEGLRIAIEVDGRAFHSDRQAFERDRVRQNLLVARGWLVLRFTWEQITQRPEQVLAAIDAAVRVRVAG